MSLNLKFKPESPENMDRAWSTHSLGTFISFLWFELCSTAPLVTESCSLEYTIPTIKYGWWTIGQLSVNNSYTGGLSNCSGVTATHPEQRAQIHTLWLWLSSERASAKSVTQCVPSQPFRPGAKRPFGIGPQYHPLAAAGETKHSDMAISPQHRDSFTVWVCVWGECVCVLVRHFWHLNLLMSSITPHVFIQVLYLLCLLLTVICGGPQRAWSYSGACTYKTYKDDWQTQ